MNKRNVSSLVIVAIIVLIGFINNFIVDSIAVALISLGCIYEFNKAFKSKGYEPITWISYFITVIIFIISSITKNELQNTLFLILPPLVVILTYITVILQNLKRNIIDICITLASIVYIPGMLCFLNEILQFPNGRLVVLYVLSAAFASDSFAFLIGTKFGKRKLCPKISPKKTVEGSIAGIIGVVVCFIIITIIGNTYFNLGYNIVYMILAGIIAAIAGQFGDLAASSVKRFTGVKDFSMLIPGHGGILDRFDSILFVAPIIYTFLLLYN